MWEKAEEIGNVKIPTCQNIIFVSYGNPSIMLEVPEFDLATTYHGVGAVTVVVVV